MNEAFSAKITIIYNYNKLFEALKLIRIIKFEMARGPVPVAKLESLESLLDHVHKRKGLNLT